MSRPDRATSTPPVAKTGHIGLGAAVALGVGGMMGAGLYTLLGLATTSTGSYLPVAFVLAACAAAFSVYSYSKLGATFPSSGGAAHFINVEFGAGLLAGGINVFQWVAYLIATSLYAAGFAEYLGALAGDSMPSWAPKVFGVAIVLVFLTVNLFGSRLVGRAESVIVALELVILAGFVVLGLFHAEPSRLRVGGGHGLVGIVTGAALLYVTYQGFGVIATVSNRMASPARELPRAMFIALGVVACLYVAISTLVVMLLPLKRIVADAGHSLADAGEVVAGRLGFVLVAAAALLATSSAVNATLFAASNVGYDEARAGELSQALTKTIGRSGTISLVTSAVVVVFLVVFFPLAAVGQMTSLAFLAVYGAVSFGHLRVRSRTGARGMLLWCAILINAALFVTLLVDAIGNGSPSTWITLLAALFGSFVFEAVFRWRSGLS